MEKLCSIKGSKLYFNGEELTPEEIQKGIFNQPKEKDV